MGFLRVDAVSKRFGEHAVINGVSLEAERGEFVVFVGPSGCGKSTLLRLIAGLEEVSDGEIFIDDARVTDTQPAARQVAMVFQSYALYPHMSVRQNMSFGLKMIGTPAADIARQVQEAAGILQIEPLLDRKPRQLSGGQRQRVAIGRAIVRHPKLFLFDEPLSNLDAELRTQMRVELARLHAALGVTMVYVTHDQVEAMTLADRIVVLRAGRVEQVGTPVELYERPANQFVAGFIGSPKMNFLKVTAAEIGDQSLGLQHAAFGANPQEGGILHLPTRGRPDVAVGDTVTLGLRPEHLALASGPATLTLTGELVENLGGTSQIYAQAPSGETLVVIVPGRHSIARGEAVTLGFQPAQAYLFAADGHAL